MSKPSSDNNTNNKENDKPRQTRDDKKIAAALQIRQQGSQLTDVSQVIVECVHTLGDDATSKRDKAKTMGHLRKVAPVCSAMSVSLPDNVKHLDPIAALGYVHKGMKQSKNKVCW